MAEPRYVSLQIRQTIAGFDGNRPLYTYHISSPENITIKGLENASSLDDIVASCYVAGWDVATLFRVEETEREVTWQAVLIKRRS